MPKVEEGKTKKKKLFSACQSRQRRSRRKRKKVFRVFFIRSAHQRGDGGCCRCMHRFQSLGSTAFAAASILCLTIFFSSVFFVGENVMRVLLPLLLPAYGNMRSLGLCMVLFQCVHQRPIFPLKCENFRRARAFTISAPLPRCWYLENETFTENGMREPNNKPTCKGWIVLVDDEKRERERKSATQMKILMEKNAKSFCFSFIWCVNPTKVEGIASLTAATTY